MLSFNDAKVLLASVSGGSFLGIDTETDVKLRGGKKNPMQGRVTKKHIGATVMVFQNKNGSAYDKMVRRRLEQEGKDPDSFELSPRAWGTRLEGIPFVEHNGAHYLEVIFIRPGESSYFLDGKPIDKDRIEGLPEPKEGSQGGLEDKVVIRTYALSSIRKLRIDGAEHMV